MNILVTTFGYSWQIIPELIGFTNPRKYNFFGDNQFIKKKQDYFQIQPVDEVWLVTSENNKNISILENWADKTNVKIKIVICKNVKELRTDYEILLMRSCIYCTVLEAKNRTSGFGQLYLSLAGGRKTMSADMQEAGNLFGYDLMLHLIDSFPDNNARTKFNEDNLLRPKSEYAEYFMPVVISEKTEKNLLLQNEELEVVDFCFKDNKFYFDDEGIFAKQIEAIKKNSSQFLANMYNEIIYPKNQERSIFYKLCFLDPKILISLKNKHIGRDKINDMAILKKLPKAELHSHLGGVLSPQDIIETAISEILNEYEDDVVFKDEVLSYVKKNDLVNLNKVKVDLFKLKKQDFKLFYKRFLTFVRCFKCNVLLFEKLVFGEYFDDKKFYSIGLVEYQNLGDFQGSSILQTENTIKKAVELYVLQLIKDNVRYVEIRCSPHKYTKLGLSVSKVIEIIINTVKNIGKDNVDFRLILIVGRDGLQKDIEDSITKIMQLHNEDQHSEFKKYIAGIDLAGTEEKNLPNKLRDSFMPILKNCLSITIHAGETEAVESIWEAVYYLSADRIGHGLKLLDNPKLMRQFLDKSIGIEMCPSSNDQIVGYSNQKPEAYPLKKYMEQGLKVTVNTDDCGISKTSLSNEFFKAAELTGRLTLWDVIVLIRNSINIAFLDKQTKSKLMQKFENEIYELCVSKEII